MCPIVRGLVVLVTTVSIIGAILAAKEPGAHIMFQAIAAPIAAKRALAAPSASAHAVIITSSVWLIAPAFSSLHSDGPAVAVLVIKLDAVCIGGSIQILDGVSELGVIVHAVCIRVSANHDAIAEIESSA
eukprot:CAMPEP_0197033412 /NCGR_PEP_ID=MMETSP1384-20130603/11830_1 /TAXON_ID=29189 /ORGANISM="Ammonia sp." /LENGTH=129 /DNA_ID=CAMNT_0042463217 /DNA_START=204 /DNA_END=593 /DNA_ORIENTATION=-